MKSFESFGSWILDTRSGLIFGCLLMLGTLGILGYEYWRAPKEVTLKASEFVCVVAEPSGLGTRCVEYRRVR